MHRELEAFEDKQQTLDGVLKELDAAKDEACFWSIVNITRLIERMRRLTVGEQNAAIRQLVEEVAPEVSSGAKEAPALKGGPLSLLPKDQCTPTALKARFGSAAAAHVYLEAALGPAPTKRKTWDYLSTVFVSGTWATKARTLARSGPELGSVNEEALGQLEARLLRRIDQLDERMSELFEQLLQRRH
jgi:hypothetical protein